MSDSSGKRWDPRSEATRVALIEAAESLFASKGFDAVSLRQVGAASGSANPTVVTYHFGSKEDFIEAIYRYRLPAIDERRAELLAQADAEGSDQDLTQLIGMLCLPLLELVDAAGRHSYGQFVFRMFGEQRGPNRLPLVEPVPATLELMARMKAQLSLSPEEFNLRLRIVTAMMLAGLRIIDGAPETELSSIKARQVFDDLMRMCAAALSAPTTPP